MSNTQLNQIASLLNTTDKNKVFSTAIVNLVDLCGMTVPEALDHVIGEGTFERMASDIYDRLNK